MNSDNTEILIGLLKGVLEKPDSSILAAGITVLGMFLVACITVLVQWVISSKTTKHEIAKLEIEARNSLKLQKHEFWLSEFTSTISMLLAKTDIEIIDKVNKKEIVPLVHKLILLLDPTKQEHSVVISKVNELSLKINGWVATDGEDLLRIHGQLIDLSQNVIHHGKN